MVNTFWTSVDPKETARCLDKKRLMKQVVEATQLLNVLQDIRFLSDYYQIEYSIENVPDLRRKYLESDFYLESKKYSSKQKIAPKEDYVQRTGYRISKGGYWSHPATWMWFYHPEALKVYSNACRAEYLSRGGKIIIPKYKYDKNFRWPHWTDQRKLIRSHQQSLVKKMPEHYEALFPGLKPFTDYIWPIDIDGW